MSKIFATSCLSLALLAGTAQVAFAEDIRRIEFSGLERVEEATVRNYLGTKEGDAYAPAKLNLALRDLYGTGLFADVEMKWADGILTVELQENPLVNRVAFEGNDELSNDALEAVATLRARAIFTPGKVQADVNEILASYRRSGYFLAKVNPQIVRRDQNRVDVVYEIDEGSKTRIERIDFIGNKEFSSNDLEQVIMTRESAWWRFLSSADSYDPDRIEFDKELLRRHYLKYGYADARVVAAVAELSKERDRFFITYTVEEGQLYNFGSVDVRISDDIGVTREELLQEVQIKSGKRYDASQVEADIEKLIDALGVRGYAFLEVVPLVRKNDVERIVEITYDIRPGPHVYVNRINIKGNTRTKDNVIRREMRLAEGDAFSSSKIRRSEDRIRLTDYFSDVTIERKETGEPDRVDLDIGVTEQSTGEFNIGAGFSTFEGVLGSVSMRERNFLGRGQTLDLALAVSGERQDIDFGFTEPWFTGRELSLGTRLFNYEREYQDQSSYDERRTGGGVTLGFPLSEFTKNTVGLTLKTVEIKEIDTDASVFVFREEGEKSSFELSNTLAYDSRDSQISPTRGSRMSWTAAYSGFGGDIDYIRNEVSASRHIPLGEQWTLSVGGRAGYLYDINDNTPLFENFYLGGNTLRGFDRAGIGPRDSTTRDALGGRVMAGHNIELRFPIGFLQDMGVQGVLFNDGGIVTDFRDEGTAGVDDSEEYRMSIGTGIFWRSPMGPLRFDFGFPIQKADEDRRQIFSFSFGTRF